MGYDTVRISELAKSLKLQSKEVIEKLEKMGITGKTHSSTVTQDQIKRLKVFMAEGEVTKAKPKAFIVKKAKVEEKEAEKEAKKEEAKELKKEIKKAIEAEKPKTIERPSHPKIEIVR